MTGHPFRWILATLVLAGVAACFLFPDAVTARLVGLERWRAGLARGALQVGDHEVVYLEGGRGEPLLLLHGITASKDHWVRVAPALTPHFRVIAPDLPGFGESTVDPEADYGLAAQVERVHAFVQALELGPIHLGGNSMGGWIAGLYAARYPAEVASLWLLAPGGVASARPSELDRRLEEGAPNPLFVEDAEAFERALAFACEDPPWIPGVVLRSLAREAVERRSFYARIYRQISDRFVPLEPAMRGLRVPTLILWGAEDRLLHVSGAEALASVLPRAEVVILERTGHLPMLERPEESARAFLRFVGERQARRHAQPRWGNASAPSREIEPGMARSPALGVTFTERTHRRAR